MTATTATPAPVTTVVYKRTRCESCKNWGTIGEICSCGNVFIDIRVDKSHFYYDYALAYAKRAMRKGGNGKASADPRRGERLSSDSHEGLVRGRRVLRHDPTEAGQQGQRATIGATELQRVDVYAAEHEHMGSVEWTEKLDDDARDIVQEAFMRWHKSRVGRPGKPQPTPLDTRSAVRFAFGAWRQTGDGRKQIRKRCSECRGQKKPCPDCEKRINGDKAAYAAFARPTGQTEAIHDTLAAVVAKPDADMLVNDVSPSLDGSKTRQQLAVVIRWLASGSTQAHIATYLHMSPKAVSRLIEKLRTMFAPEQFISSYRDTLFAAYGPQAEQRTYGDRPTGERSVALSKLMDMLDVFGHATWLAAD